MNGITFIQIRLILFYNDEISEFGDYYIYIASVILDFSDPLINISLAVE